MLLYHGVSSLQATAPQPLCAPAVALACSAHEDPTAGNVNNARGGGALRDGVERKHLRSKAIMIRKMVDNEHVREELVLPPAN